MYLLRMEMASLKRLKYLVDWRIGLSGSLKRRVDEYNNSFVSPSWKKSMGDVLKA